MAEQLTEAAQSWKQRIDQWQKSGKSLAQWSRENNFTYSQSLYWKGRFLGKSAALKGFIELQDEEENDSGVAVEISGLRIRLTEDFDSAAFLRCISLLKGKAC